MVSAGAVEPGCADAGVEVIVLVGGYEQCGVNQARWVCVPQVVELLPGLADGPVGYSLEDPLVPGLRRVGGFAWVE